MGVHDNWRQKKKGLMQWVVMIIGDEKKRTMRWVLMIVGDGEKDTNAMGGDNRWRCEKNPRPIDAIGGSDCWRRGKRYPCDGW